MLPRAGERSPCLPFPYPKRFVVACLDPVGMVEDLENADPQALQEARCITPKKYIFYLSTPLDLPGPDSQWCRYSAYPVAPALRAIDRELGITPDMVMPIAPNNRYAKGRQPLRAEPTFPFDNCFFWVESSMDVRVRRRGNDGYDDRGATRLSVREHVAMLLSWDEDARRIAHFIEEKKRRLSSLSTTSPHPETSSPLSQPQTSKPLLHPETSCDTAPMPPPASSDDSSTKSTNMSDSDQVSATSSDDLRHYNLFGWDHDPEFAFMPLLEAAVELEDYIAPQEIGDPTDFLKEQDAIKDVIQRFLARRANAEPVPGPSAPASRASVDGGAESMSRSGKRYRYLTKSKPSHELQREGLGGPQKRAATLDLSPPPAKRSKIAGGISKAKLFIARAVYGAGWRSMNLGPKSEKRYA